MPLSLIVVFVTLACAGCQNIYVSGVRRVMLDRPVESAALVREVRAVEGVRQDQVYVSEHEGQTNIRANLDPRSKAPPKVRLVAVETTGDRTRLTVTVSFDTGFGSYPDVAAAILDKVEAAVRRAADGNGEK